MSEKTLMSALGLPMDHDDNGQPLYSLHQIARAVRREGLEVGRRFNVVYAEPLTPPQFSAVLDAMSRVTAGDQDDIGPINAGFPALAVYQRALDKLVHLRRRLSVYGGVDAQAGEVLRLKEALRIAKSAILAAAKDTLWCSDSPVETVVDRIDAVLADETLELPLPPPELANPLIRAATYLRMVAGGIRVYGDYQPPSTETQEHFRAAAVSLEEMAKAVEVDPECVRVSRADIDLVFKIAAETLNRGEGATPEIQAAYRAMGAIQTALRGVWS